MKPPKEDLRPNNADRWVYEFAPYATFIPVLLVLATLPFAESWGVRSLPLGMFFVFAVLGLNIVGIMMAGLGSGNKYALLGAVRAAAQMISYEIPLVLSLISVAMVSGTLNLNEMALLQEDRPFVILQPLALLIFVTAMLSELLRAPFDIPVAESEIVGGYFVEYSGIRWSMFQLTEYASMLAFSVFGSVVFLGGWEFPMGSDWGWGWQLFLTLEGKTGPERIWDGVWLSHWNGQTMARFADHGFYFYRGQRGDDKFHLGVDLASLTNAPVLASNTGKVIFADTLGIYGLAVVIDHGQGLSSVYGHLSKIEVSQGQAVKKGEVIGLTGDTGLAGGDHLHFSVMLQGIFVNPVEWWDPHCITDNVTKKLSLVD